MPSSLSKVASWFGLEVVHVVVIRRSRHGDLRLIQSTFPSDHPTNITLTLEEEEALIQRRQSDGLPEKGSEMTVATYHCGGMD
ncbi:uncharacterized protein N7511_004332 [Penicillium nucicola]|uniref:uncharacterized protein n=1 Tax=Penicillium nucicola TaxID=1850975 RepID=UPI0025454A4D|nr:uncharacterized protein N7511_004281 [Penicillium nucicola]XP_056985647.1 uncharacterized protein N7511_004332 [Penicillium nucicola]KAJ5766665.1 hypothetical protein N7511_004281 [Penicillium nucicola]KAJ5766716.1 hypothetical protein N7511_004332 [Penicillium nucicola]